MFPLYKVDLILMVLLLPGTTVSFLLDTTCFVSPPCRCVPDGVYCASMGLNSIPLFDSFNWTKNTLNINLNNNSITEIADNSFMNIDVDDQSKVNLYFQSNSISRLSEFCFEGIEDSVSTINLTDNQVKELPRALGNLTNLLNLYIDKNPLTNLAQSTMISIGQELQTLDIDMSSFSTWPSSLQELTILDTLVLHGVPFQNLPNNAFHGFENDLLSLSIIDSSLSELSNALCNLNNLTQFTFEGNTHLQNNILQADPCHKNIFSQSMSMKLKLRSNKLARFPNILMTAGTYNTVDVGNNNLQYIEENLIPKCNITSVYLDSNKFVRIPNALNNLEFIFELNLAFNEILSIEDTDLRNMKYLNRLFIENNKIEYIHSRAFSSTSLRTLNLANNRLKSIPETMKYVHPTAMINLEGNVVDCSCLSFDSYSWNTTRLSLKGKCETGTELLQTFLSTVPQRCLS